MRANSSLILSPTQTHTMHTPPNWYKTCPGFDSFENKFACFKWQPSFLSPPPSSVLWFPFLRSALNKLFSAIMANTFQSVASSLFNLISRVLISPIHLLAAIWFTMVTPFLAAKNPILMKFVIPWRIRDFIYVGIRPSHPPHASWVVNWLGKQAGGYIHIRYTPTCLVAVPWAVTNGSVSELLHVISHTETQRPVLALYKNCDNVLLQLHGTWNSFLNFFSPLPSHLFNVCYFSPFLSWSIQSVWEPQTQILLLGPLLPVSSLGLN